MVAVWEKVVDELQFTVTWPDCWLWTSIDEPDTAATDPEEPENGPAPGVVAAPATLAAATLVANEMPMMAMGTAHNRGMGRFMMRCTPSFPMRSHFRCDPLIFNSTECHSLRRASMGASRAARDAGYTPNTRPMAMATTKAPTLGETERAIGYPMA